MKLLILVLILVVFGRGIVAQPRFGGSGRPPVYAPGEEPMVNRTANPRPLGALNLDVLWKELLTNRPYNTIGALSDEDRKFFQNADPKSPEYIQRQQAHLKSFFDSLDYDRKSGADNSPRVEIMEKLKTVEKMDVSSQAIEGAKRQVNAMVPKSTKDVVARTRQKLSGNGRGGRLFGVADALLLGSTIVTAKRDVQEDQDIEARVCRKKPSSSYVQKVMLQDIEVQRAIAQKCKEQGQFSPSSLDNQVMLKRVEARSHFASGKSECKIGENGLGVAEVISDQGTRQILEFNKNGMLDKIKILPQDEKFNGSFLEYTGFPTYGKVRYTGIKSPKSSEMTPDFSKAQFESEDLLSFAARIHCTMEGCDSSGDETFQKIKHGEFPPDVSARKPFGSIQPNSEFFVKAAKTIGHFRQGIEQNYEMPMTFRNVCLQLGTTAPHLNSGDKPVDKKDRPTPSRDPFPFPSSTTR